MKVKFKAGLIWPDTAPPVSQSPKPSAFDSTRSLYAALNGKEGLLDELRKSKATNIIITADWNLSKRDETPLTDGRVPSPMSVFYKIGGVDLAHAMCEYNSIESNVWAAARTIEKLRDIRRYGGDAIARQAESGFAALPPPEKSWWEILGVSRDMELDEIEALYKLRRNKVHPDRPGGDNEKFIELGVAFEQAKKEKGTVPAK